MGRKRDCFASYEGTHFEISASVARGQRTRRLEFAARAGKNPNDVCRRRTKGGGEGDRSSTTRQGKKNEGKT